jgi:putative lipoprotein (rSAM/lipoprotein system)
MKVRVKRWYQAILSALLTILGFETCSVGSDGDDAPIICEYGMPFATYNLKGTVTDETGKPIEGIKTSVKYVFDRPTGETEAWGIDSVKTDADGQYKLQTDDIHNDIRLIVEDVDGMANGGQFRSDTLSIDRSKAVKTAEGDGNWYMGTFEIRNNIKMKKDEADTPDA